MTDEEAKGYVDKLRAGAGLTLRSRRFPMMDGPSIDWTTAQEIYTVYSCLHGTGQSIERIAERGGFGWAEVPWLLKRHQEIVRDQRCTCQKTR